MASVQREIRARAEALLFEGAGATGYTIAPGRFRRAIPGQELEAHEAATLERAAEIELGPRLPLAGRNSYLCGQGLYAQTLTVRVGYVVGVGEAEYEATGAQSGASTWEAVQDRAADDAQVIAAALGYQPSWASVTPVVIDPAATDPAPADPTVTREGDRAILTISQTILTRADQYTAYGPTVTP